LYLSVGSLAVNGGTVLEGWAQLGLYGTAFRSVNAIQFSVGAPAPSNVNILLVQVSFPVEYTNAAKLVYSCTLYTTEANSNLVTDTQVCKIQAPSYSTGRISSVTAKIYRPDSPNAWGGVNWGHLLIHELY